MKKIIFILSILLISSKVHAQIIDGFGIKAGTVFASQDFKYKEIPDADWFVPRNGFSAGAFVRTPIFSNFKMMAEIFYIQKGMTDEQMMTSESGAEIGKMKFDNLINYLSFSILFRNSISVADFSPYILFGPRIDYKINHQSNFMNILYDEFKNYDFGGDVGLGMESGRFLIEGRYNHNFFTSYSTEYLNVKNKSFQILFGLTL